MTEAKHSENSVSLEDSSVDFQLAIDAFRLLGAGQFDPVQFHFLAVLADRTHAQQGPVKRILGAKLTLALDAFRTRFERAQTDAAHAINLATTKFPQAGADLQRRLKAGDFKGLGQVISKLESADARTSLADLSRYLTRQPPAQGAGRLDEAMGARAELKSVQYFRNTWSKLSADKQVTQALVQAPKNAGPINSHMLVLRSLALMREISPDYLNRFVSYVDTLLSLDRRDVEKPKTRPPRSR